MCGSRAKVSWVTFFIPGEPPDLRPGPQKELKSRCKKQSPRHIDMDTYGQLVALGVFIGRVSTACRRLWSCYRLSVPVVSSDPMNVEVETVGDSHRPSVKQRVNTSTYF